jgi:hypothetical protein
MVATKQQTFKNVVFRLHLPYGKARGPAIAARNIATDTNAETAACSLVSDISKKNCFDVHAMIKNESEYRIFGHP